MRGGVFCLFFCCISALSAHYLFNKPCRGWRPRQPAFWTLHLVIYYTNFEKTHKLWQGRALFASFGHLHKFVTIKKIRQFDIGTSRAPSPTIQNLQQVLSTGERCSPLRIVRASLSFRKIATLGAVFYFILEHNSGQLCQFLIPHSSLLI